MDLSGRGDDRLPTVRVDRSALSFEVSGNVLAVNVDIGAEVEEVDALNVLRASLPGMLSRNRGHVVNMSSVAGLYPIASPIYGASKGAVHRLSQNLRIELGGSRVRLTEICPGRVATEFFDAAIDDPAKRSAVKDTGISELTSDDIAAAVIYAVDAPWRVNVSLIELQPTEQVFGGMSIVPATD